MPTSPVARWLSRVGRSPLVHFLGLGALLWLLVSLAETRRPLEVGPGQVEALAADYRSVHQREPSDSELARLVDDWVEQELKVREARRLELHRGDLVIHRRLVEKAERLLGSGNLSGSTGAETSTETSAETSADHFEQALELGLDVSDTIVRRRLVQRLEQRWLAELGGLQATDEDLRRHLEAHADRYRVPPRARVRHVFFARADGEPPGNAAELRARRAVERLDTSTAEIPPDLGDPFPFGRDLPLRTERKLADSLGADAARLAFSVPVGRWSGPVASPWGAHLLFVHERVDGAMPSLDEVREPLRRELAARRAEAYLERRDRELRRERSVRFTGETARRLAGLLAELPQDAETPDAGSGADPQAGTS